MRSGRILAALAAACGLAACAGTTEQAGREVAREITKDIMRDATLGQAIRWIDAPSLPELMREAHTARVHTRKGRDYEFAITAVRSDAFYGRLPNGKNYKVPYGVISVVALRRGTEDWRVYAPDRVQSNQAAAATARRMVSGMVFGIPAMH